MNRLDWQSDDPERVVRMAVSPENASRDPRLLRLAVCAVCRILARLDASVASPELGACLSEAENFADGMLTHRERRDARFRAISLASDSTMANLQRREYARGVSGALAEDTMLPDSLRAAVRLADMWPRPADARNRSYLACSIAVRDIFSNGILEDGEWRLSRPQVAWRWQGPLPVPITWREPGITQWRNQGFLRPEWARNPEEWKTAQELILAALEAQVTYGLVPARNLQVVGDCLEEMGCNDVALLQHLHSSGPHFRGCWAVDTLTGKE